MWTQEIDKGPEDWANGFVAQREHRANEWRKYRSAKGKTYQEADPFVGSRSPVEDVVEQKENEDVWKDLNKHRFGALQDATRWNAEKLLGSGTFGIVYLCRYKGNNKRVEKQVVLKVMRKPKERPWHDLNNEADLLKELKTTADSQHIVRYITESVMPNDHDRVEKLYMEYCEKGSLDTLLTRRLRKRNNKPAEFDEKTLWWFMRCLVDGLIVLEFGTEKIPKQPPAQDASEWDEICHHDLKPENILLGDFDPEHSVVPVCKIADFGQSECINAQTFRPDGMPDDVELQEGWEDLGRLLRRDRTGTDDYHPPETFTDEWEKPDWKTSEVAGRYSAKTNVWGMGVIMYQLVLLTQPFYPTSYKSGKQNLQKGPLFGKLLEESADADNYSWPLRELILRCLYEKPANRPALAYLSEKVDAGWKIAHHNHPESELDVMGYAEPDDDIPAAASFSSDESSDEDDASSDTKSDESTGGVNFNLTGWRRNRQRRRRPRRGAGRIGGALTVKAPRGIRRKRTREEDGANGRKRPRRNPPPPSPSPPPPSPPAPSPPSQSPPSSSSSSSPSPPSPGGNNDAPGGNDQPGIFGPGPPPPPQILGGMDNVAQQQSQQIQADNARVQRAQAAADPGLRRSSRLRGKRGKR